MTGMTSDWEKELGRWLRPFLDRLGHKTRRQMCPLYVTGLIGPGERKSIQPIAARFALGEYDQLHHFVSAGVWDVAPVERELLVQADKLLGGSDAVLVIDDTAILKKGKHSVGVAPQYCSALGKVANCQTLVSLTLARREVPIMLALRLFLPESWTSDQARLKRAGVQAGSGANAHALGEGGENFNLLVAGENVHGVNPCRSGSTSFAGNRKLLCCRERS